MAINKIDAKQIQKVSSVTSEVPTIGPSLDHTDGTWTATEIYSGEFFLNEADSRLWIGVGGTVMELQTSSLTSALWVRDGEDIKAVENALTSPLIYPNILPPADDVSDLGSSSLRWKDLYLGSVIDFATNLRFDRAATKIVDLTSAGLVVASGLSITTDNGTGALHLDAGAAGAVALSSDGLGYTQGWFYGDSASASVGFSSAQGLYLVPGYVSLYADTANMGVELYGPGNGDGISIFAPQTAGFVDLRGGNYIQLRTQAGTDISNEYGEILVKNNSAGNEGTDTLTDNRAVFIGARSAVINSGVTNSVIAATGTGITATADDTLYTENLWVGTGTTAGVSISSAGTVDNARLDDCSVGVGTRMQTKYVGKFTTTRTSATDGTIVVDIGEDRDGNAITVASSTWSSSNVVLTLTLPTAMATSDITVVSSIDGDSNLDFQFEICTYARTTTSISFIIIYRNNTGVIDNWALSRATSVSFIAHAI